MVGLSLILAEIIDRVIKYKFNKADSIARELIQQGLVDKVSEIRLKKKGWIILATKS